MGMVLRWGHGGGHWPEGAPAEGGGARAPEVQESSVLTSPLASDIIARRSGWPQQPSKFPGAAEHWGRPSPSTCEDFCCLLCCWHSCLSLSSPSLHTSLWCKPYSSTARRVRCCYPPAWGRGAICNLLYLFIVWQSSPIVYCKYKLFFLSNNQGWAPHSFPFWTHRSFAFF